MALFAWKWATCMTINLNNLGALNFANVRTLLAAGRTNIELEIRVTHGGIVFLSDVTGPHDLDDICFRITDMNMDLNDAEFVGPNAAAATDDRLVDQVQRTIAKYWKNKPSRPSVDLEPYFPD
jgi:hypothetical protein